MSLFVGEYGNVVVGLSPLVGELKSLAEKRLWVAWKRRGGRGQSSREKGW